MTALRSNYTPGTSPWAVRRAQWRALGLTDEDMAKPKIAIVNSSSQLATCYSHLDDIARAARRRSPRPAASASKSAPSPRATSSTAPAAAAATFSPLAT